MDIVTRLKLFLKENGIGNAQFADTCAIPRPTVSQLLNGRNKKVSDEIISKIHNGYPKLNIMWLMFGDGGMFVPNANSSSAPYPASADRADGQAAPQAAPQESVIHQQTSISFGEPDDEEPYAPAPAAFPSSRPLKMAQDTSLSAALANLAQAASNGTRVNAASESADGRRIVNIMVFYSDNSFESFVPGGK